jgi:hypothetical protein
MSIHGLLFQWASTIKIQISVLVCYKADLIIISLKINLSSLWYSWKIAELMLNNNHSLLEPTIYRTRGEHANHYATIMVPGRIQDLLLLLYITNKIWHKLCLQNSVCILKKFWGWFRTAKGIKDLIVKRFLKSLQYNILSNISFGFKTNFTKFFEYTNRILETQFVSNFISYI